VFFKNQLARIIVSGGEGGVCRVRRYCPVTTVWRYHRRHQMMIVLVLGALTSTTLMQNQEHEEEQLINNGQIDSVVPVFRISRLPDHNLY